MISVESPFTAEAKDRTRHPSQSVQVAWKKNFDPSITIFTIGVSTIGGTDLIGGGSAPTAWGKYQYWDESDYVTDLAYERTLATPIGGINRALANVGLDNTSGRFLPNYMGGNSEIFTAILPRRPIIINTGFNYGGVDNNIPQFVGILDKQVRVDKRRSLAELSAIDMLDFLYKKPIDISSMFTGLTTDQMIETILTNLGYATADYELDTGLNTIQFALLESGRKYGDFIQQIVEAENARFYMDETGILRFENRQHWDNAPHNSIVQVLYTPDVLDAETPDEDNIINVVEVKSNIRAKQATQQVWQLSEPITLPTAPTVEYWVNFDDPMLSIDTPSFAAFDNSDGSGTERTSSVSIVKIDRFAQSMKLVFSNAHSSTVYITSMTITGRPARVVAELYHRAQDDSSVTAYEERGLTIDNNFIQDTDWAQSYALMILQSYAEPENIQKITIRARPHLQLGDLISWQGHYWRVHGIKTHFNPSVGFVQELKLIIGSTATYFRIGISTIGGPDAIAA